MLGTSNFVTMVRGLDWLALPALPALRDELVLGLLDDLLLCALDAVLRGTRTLLLTLGALRLRVDA